MGLVDQGSRGGGGEIWQRGRPSGGGGSRGGGVSQKETNIWPSIHATNKKTNTQIKKWSFCMRIRVLVQRNHLFGKTNIQKTVAKVKSLHTEEKPSFVYLCICVSGQRNHSLRSMCKEKISIS